MQLAWEALNGWVFPIALTAGGIVSGIIAKKFVFSKLRKIARYTRWEWDNIIISATRRMIIFWFTLGGIYGALLNIPVALAPAHQSLIHRTFTVLVIFSITVVLARVGVGLVNLYSKRKDGIIPSTTIFANITKAVILIIGFLMVLQSMGISITPVLTALGVGGLAVALALQDTLSNLFAGLQIIIAQQIRPGAYVQLDTGDRGYVEDINWRNTTIRALGNNLTIIPNAKLAQAIITNFDLPEKEMSVIVNVGVHYDSDLEKVEKVAMDVARQTLKEVEGAQPDFEPLVRYNTFNNSSIDFAVILRASEYVNQYLLQHEFIKRLHRRFNEEGIVIPFPIQTVYLKNEEAGPTAAKTGRRKKS
ncbi:MAG TPA: mechanosensitive ion channel family protein [Spirochaetes bacterium]|nr:mechanosensitive ion channel family protein [Spirochaetota bacterium]